MAGGVGRFRVHNCLPDLLIPHLELPDLALTTMTLRPFRRLFGLLDTRQTPCNTRRFFAPRISRHRRLRPPCQLQPTRTLPTSKPASMVVNDVFIASPVRPPALAHKARSRFLLDSRTRGRTTSPPGRTDRSRTRFWIRRCCRSRLWDADYLGARMPNCGEAIELV